MREDVEPGLINDAKELIDSSDIEIMALSLENNSDWGNNYQMAMTIKLRQSLDFLNKDIIKLRKSMSVSSWVMGLMTLIILILTGVLAWKGL